MRTESVSVFMITGETGTCLGRPNRQNCSQPVDPDAENSFVYLAQLSRSIYSRLKMEAKPVPTSVSLVFIFKHVHKIAKSNY
jgi:hypothetical protein